MFNFWNKSKQGDLAILFEDGSKITAEEFGFYSVRWSSDLSAKFIRDEFGSGKPCSGYRFSSGIEVAPFFAHLTLISFYTGCYLSYLKVFLIAEEEMCVSFINGVTRSLSEIRDSNRKALHPELLSKVGSNVNIFCNKISATFRNSEDIDPTAFSPSHTKYTQLLLAELDGWYGTPTLLSGGSLASDELVVSSRFDNEPMLLLNVIRKLGISVVKQ